MTNSFPVGTWHPRQFPWIATSICPIVWAAILVGVTIGSVLLAVRKAPNASNVWPGSIKLKLNRLLWFRVLRLAVDFRIMLMGPIRSLSVCRCLTARVTAFEMQGVVTEAFGTCMQLELVQASKTL